MEKITQALQQFLQNPMDCSEYRPPTWESPIEQLLWGALRSIGLWIETQVTIGSFRVDMLIASRMNRTTVIVECDGAKYHHELIDDFRDDELIRLTGLPIAHIHGSAIVRSAEECAVYIVERWFPEHMNTVGYAEALEILEEADIEHQLTGDMGFFPVGRDRPTLSGLDMSSSVGDLRELVRYVTGATDEFFFSDSKQQEIFSAIREYLSQHGLIGRRLNLQELARVYILVRYEEPKRSTELSKFDEFINQRKAWQHSKD